MSILFTPAKIGTLELSNRMIRTASHEGLADQRGMPTDEQFQFYKGLLYVLMDLKRNWHNKYGILSILLLYREK